MFIYWKNLHNFCVLYDFLILSLFFSSPDQCKIEKLSYVYIIYHVQIIVLKNSKWILIYLSKIWKYLATYSGAKYSKHFTLWSHYNQIFFLNLANNLLFVMVGNSIASFLIIFVSKKLFHHHGKYWDEEKSKLLQKIALQILRKKVDFIILYPEKLEKLIVECNIEKLIF